MSENQITDVPEKKFRKRVRRAGKTQTRRALEKAQILIEMGDKEAFEKYKAKLEYKERLRKKALIKENNKLLHQNVIAKHKPLTKKKPVCTLVTNKQPKKKKANITLVPATTPGQSSTYRWGSATFNIAEPEQQLPGPVLPEIIPVIVQRQEAEQKPGSRAAVTELEIENLPTIPNQPPLTRKRGKRGGVKNKKLNKTAIAHTAKYVVPVQDDLEDLTDDCAPNMLGHAGQSQTSSGQPQTVTENKLNFKFQRTVPKTADWSEYQNKFKRIGGGSPDVENVEGEPIIKQEPNQSGYTVQNKKPSDTSYVTDARQGAKNTAPQKGIVIQKVEIIKKANQAAEPRETTPTSTEVRPMAMNSKMKKTAYFQRDSNIIYNFEPTGRLSKPYHRDYPNPGHPAPGYPSGIPRSFLTPEHLMQQQAAPVPLSRDPNQGLPSKFLTNEQYMMQQVTQMSQQINPTVDYQSQPTTYVDLPSWILPTPAAPKPVEVEIYEGVANVRRDQRTLPQPERPDRAYSPSDVYAETGGQDEESRDGSESPDSMQPGQKRLSAFKRLGPLTQPKKPKLTINLTLNKEQAVREVVDETDDSYRFIPVHLRKDILQSDDEVVVKFLPFWPWKRNVGLRKTVTSRFSKSVMILEQEQMEAGYEKDSLFIQISVKGYPKTWTKENVLDAILECVKGKSFIPCFIEFTPKECKFLVIRCKAALLAIHKVGFCIRIHDVELNLSISLTDTSLNQIDLIPRLVLRKKLMSQYDGERTLDLKEFLAGKDVSHFVYFPLSRPTNQAELVQLQSAVAWAHLAELTLARNRLTSVDGFDLPRTTPKLKHLDLSHNCLDKLTMLLRLRELPLRSLKLEGNPLCHDYIDSAHYVKVVRMIFSGVRQLDGVHIPLKGELPRVKRNWCPEDAVPVVEKFLETFFPLLEAPQDDRAAIEALYDKDAVLTITFRYKLRYGQAYRYFRNLFLRARSVEQRDAEAVRGAGAVAALLDKWPALLHDRYSITVDVMHHDDSTTILRVGGVLKVTSETLAEDEHLLTFTRNIVLHTRNGAEYKVHNEMLYWDVPSEDVARNAFNVTTVRARPLSIKLDSPPDEYLKSKLVDIFVKLTEIDKRRGKRCLELKNWDLRSALEFYVTLLKQDDLSVLSTPKESSTPVPQTS